ncbi:MAG: shikimate kinase [Pseudomonadota bacterium]
MDLLILSKRAHQRDQAEQATQVKALIGEKSLVLVGLMGCGKTAIGKRLARHLSLPFVDADEEIELAAAKSVAEIFQDHGEAYFRDRERLVITRLLASGPQVLATGGGAYMNDETRDTIKQRGVSVWLRAELPVLLRRVLRRDHRPLLKTGDPAKIMQRLMEERYPVYGLADVCVESRDVAHEAIVAEIIKRLCAMPNLS